MFVTVGGKGDSVSKCRWFESCLLHSKYNGVKDMSSPVEGIKKGLACHSSHVANVR